MSGSLTDLVADLEYAAGPGAQLAGRQAVEAGVAHADNNMRDLIGTQVSSHQSEGLSAVVTAKQDTALNLQGPHIAAPAGIADAMADKAAEAGAAALGGKG